LRRRGDNQAVRGVLVAVTLAALVAVAGVLAKTLTRPDPNTLAAADGCERNDATLIQGRSPNWARVTDSTTKATEAPPPLRWAEGVASSNGLPWYSPHVSGGDLPYSHAGYDFNLDVLLDPAYADLIGIGNTATAGAESSEAGRLHTEREAQRLPFFAWPEPGDRVRLLGYWVWDCDHYQPAGERTELHPIVGLWVKRKWSPNSRTGETEADLYLTTDKTTAGKQADCAHKTKHDQSAFKACLATERDYVDIGGTYKYVLSLPPSSRGGRKLVRIVDMGSVNRPPIRAATTGGPWNQAGIAFTIPHDGRRHVVALRVFARWAARRSTPLHYRVSVEKILIRRAMDPACIPQRTAPCGTPQTTREDQVSHGPTGEWNVYWSVGGNWSLWKPTVLRPRDGQTLRPKVSTDVWVPRGKRWRVFVWPRECDWGTLALGGSGALFPCPKQGEAGVRAGDDVPGGTLKTFTAGERVEGLHTLANLWPIASCPRGANPSGCYDVTIRVRRIR
jgi:hypothetical protein